MDRPLIVMLDLENTIVDTWCSQHPLMYKQQDIYDRVQTLDGVTGWGVFSYAVELPHEKATGLQIVRDNMPWLTQLPTEERWCPCFRDLEKLLRLRMDSLEKWEIVDLYGKEIMLAKWARQFPEFNFALFDDTCLSPEAALIRRIGEHMQTLHFFRV